MNWKFAVFNGCVFVIMHMLMNFGTWQATAVLFLGMILNISGYFEAKYEKNTPHDGGA